MKGMASSYGVCICRLGGVYVRCGWGRRLVLHWPGFFKEPGFNSPRSYWFYKKFLHWWDKFVIGKINSKSWECIPNLCTYPMISLTFENRQIHIHQMTKKKHIRLVKCILNFNEELGRFVKDWNRHPFWHPFSTRSPTEVSPVFGDGRLRAQSSRFRSAFRSLDPASCMIHPSSICRRNQNAHTEEDEVAENKI